MIERRHHNNVPSAGAAFEMQVVGEGSTTVLRVGGELDIAARTQMKDALGRACDELGGRLTVDASGLSFIDASSVGLLVAANNRLLAGGRGGLVIKGASGIVRRVFEITRLTSLLDEPASAGSTEDGSTEDGSTGDGSTGDGSTGGLRPRKRWDQPDLEQARQESGLAPRDLFVAYFGLGGTADLAQVAAHLRGAPLDSHQHDIVVHALNERLIDLGHRERLLSYAADR